MKPTRRILLKGTALAASIAVAPWTARGQAKATKAGSQGECKVVEGPISPKGWCAAYVKKA